MRRTGRPRRFSEEFRQDAVRLAREPNRSLTALGEELGVSVTTLRTWLKEAPKAKTAAGRVVSLEEQVRQLKRENDQLREERAILKKATAFFAKDAR